MKNQIKIPFTTILLLLIMLAHISGGWAAEDATGDKKSIDVPSITSADKQPIIGKLHDIVNSIQLQKEEIDARLELLQKAKTKQEKNKIQAEINESARAIEEQEASFELILTAGQEFPGKEADESKVFDWQKDLLEIIQPILSELRQLTEKKRKLDNLKKKIAFYQAQAQEISEVLVHIAQFDRQALESAALHQFEKIEKKWRDELLETNHLLEVTQMQLDEMLKSHTAKEISMTEHIKQFFFGRGATLLMTIGTFAAVYFSLLLIWKWFVWIGFRKRTQWTYYQRLVLLIYYSLAVLLAIAAAFYVLSVRNDQVLLAIAVLLLVSIIWVLKNSIPRYVDELKLLLNTGSVREGECIYYHGIPMKIDRLSFYKILINPAIPDLKLRLPLSQLSNYVSRPYMENEPWFPCQTGDYVMLADGRYGKVNCITLENVQLSLSDGSMPQTFTVSDFLSAGSKNLSQGFLITSVIGIDYQYQSQCTTAIPRVFQEGIRQGLVQEAYGHALKGIWVNFDQANTSSLDYKIIVTFEGAAAPDYYSIKRDLQRFAVDVCNQQQWAIPFSQVVVHQS